MFLLMMVGSKSENKHSPQPEGPAQAMLIYYLRSK